MKILTIDLIFILGLLCLSVLIVTVINSEGDFSQFCEDKGYEYNQFMVDSYCYKIEGDNLIYKEMKMNKGEIYWAAKDERN